MQVLWDNPYEVSLSRQRVDEMVAGAAAGDAAGQQPTSMEVEVEVEEAGAAVAAVPAGPSRSSLAGSSGSGGGGGEVLLERKTVRFEGVPPAYVPPVHREGYQQR